MVTDQIMPLLGCFFSIFCFQQSQRIRGPTLQSLSRRVAAMRHKSSSKQTEKTAAAVAQNKSIKFHMPTAHATCTPSAFPIL